MVNQSDNPVTWALLMYELNDAREHLESLLRDMTADEAFDETDLRIQLGHVYAHLNRAWNRRNEVQEPTAAQWEAQSQFPTDLEPV